MRLNIGSACTTVGNVETHELIRVVEQDAGHSFETNVPNTINSGVFNAVTKRTSVPFSRGSLHSIESRLTIVIPCKDEDTSILIGVLLGIPHDCLIIIVSNSTPSNFEAECRLLEKFCDDTQRPGIAVHQQDKDLAHAFKTAGMVDLVEKHLPDGKQNTTWRVRNGKGEGMIIGTAVAKLAGKQFVGFIDADNLVTGAVNEYCKVFAAGLHYALRCTKSGDSDAGSEPDTMVRIKWNSKPKVKDNQLVFEKSGRSSRVVNEWMNRLLDTIVDNNKPSDIIQTANAGEHAMGINLAMKLRFATGYAVEPAQLVDAWERFGAPILLHSQTGVKHAPPNRSTCCSHDSNAGSNEVTPVSANSSSSTTSSYFSPSTIRPPTPTSQKIRILQVETCSPHFHDTSKGDDHIQKMQADGLSTIYHSSLIPAKLKEELRVYLKDNLPDVIGVDGVPKKAAVYPPMEMMDFEVFGQAVKASAETLKIFGDMEGKVLV